MKKNTSSVAAAMVIAMAICGFGINTELGSIKAQAAAQEIKTKNSDKNDAESKDEATASEAIPEETIEETKISAEKKLPQGFTVIGLNNDIRTLDALVEALTNLQDKMNERKFILEVNGEHIESTYGELGVGIENKDFILEEAEKYTSGNMIERFAKCSELESNPESIALNIVFNDDIISAFFERANGNNPNAPVNAAIRRVNGVFEITKEQDGYAIDKDSTVAKMKEAVLKDGEETIQADMTKQAASIKADDLKDIKDVLGSFTTNYSSSSSDRATNIAVGTSKIDGALLMPGETLSGYARMQPFTTKNGYKMAKAYQDGLVIDSVGGGACQIATTLYNAALRAEIQITERQNHSMIVGYVQPSGDAAIAGDYKDIKVTNNRSTPIYVEGVTSGRNVTFTIWGKEDRPANRTVEFVSEVIKETPKGRTYRNDPSRPEGYLRKESDGHKGRVSKLWKVVSENGVEVSRELISSDTYRMANDIYIRGTGVPAPAPTPAPTESSPEDSTDNPEPTDNATPVEPAPTSPENYGPAFDPNLNPGQ